MRDFPESEPKMSATIRRGGRKSSPHGRPAMAWNILHAIEILKNTCRVVARKCILGIKANRETCERYAYRTPSIATALNPIICYARAAEIVKKALATGKSVPEVCREEKLLTRRELDYILDPRRMTEPGLPPSRGRKVR